jgi:hypothetical protein
MAKKTGKRRAKAPKKVAARVPGRSAVGKRVPTQVVPALSPVQIRRLLKKPPPPPGPPGPPAPVQLVSVAVNGNNQVSHGDVVTLNVKLQGGSSDGIYAIRVVATLYKGTAHGAAISLIMNDWSETSVLVQVAASQTKSLDLPTTWQWSGLLDADRVFDKAPTMFLVTLWTQDGASILGSYHLIARTLTFAKF